MKRNNFQKGFTLIEMVVVIAVIGVLMGVTFTGTRNIQANARDTRRIADLKKVQGYLELYYNKCGHYPAGTTNDCAVGAAAPTYAQLVTVIEGTVAGSGEMPHDPITTRDYLYGADMTSGQQGFSYVIGATMEKGIPSGGVSSTTFSVTCNSNNVYCPK